MNFTKYHIAGKDYIFIAGENDFSRLQKNSISSLCNRHKGIGAEGIFTFNKNQGKMSLLRGFTQNGDIMQNFSSASICGFFEQFLLTTATEYTFSSESGINYTVNAIKSDSKALFGAYLKSSQTEGIFSTTNRKTEIGNRILTVTPIELISIYAVHFSDCKEKLQLSYLGHHISHNSMLKKSASLILAQETDKNTFDISFYENSTGNSRPDISAFAATALAACKNSICRFGDEISVSYSNNKVDVICFSEKNVYIKASCERVFLGNTFCD